MDLHTKDIIFGRHFSPLKPLYDVFGSLEHLEWSGSRGVVRESSAGEVMDRSGLSQMLFLSAFHAPRKWLEAVCLEVVLLQSLDAAITIEGLAFDVAQKEK